MAFIRMSFRQILEVKTGSFPYCVYGEGRLVIPRLDVSTQQAALQLQTCSQPQLVLGFMELGAILFLEI
uniref:Uncharacterized protein n=1 Tax=Arundo donax TaxID=35708 RepID=A0A0A9EMF4_ARUDO